MVQRLRVSWMAVLVTFIVFLASGPPAGLYVEIFHDDMVPSCRAVEYQGIDQEFRNVVIRLREPQIPSEPPVPSEPEMPRMPENQIANLGFVILAG